MDRLREDFSIQCRLCSSKSALISLFKGKNKQIRNYIRKLMEITTGIKCEANDYFECICYTCILYIFNMHVFRTKSLKNEERLQALAPDKVPHRGKNNNIKWLKDIELLEYNELKCIFSNWMQNKTGLYSSDSTFSSQTSSKESDSVPVIISVDSYVQTEPPAQYSVSVQTVCKTTVSTIDTQTESTQYETSNDKSVNCRIREKQYDVSSQTVITKLNKSVQTHISHKEPNACDNNHLFLNKKKSNSKCSECVHNNISIEKIERDDLQLFKNGTALGLQFTLPDNSLQIVSKKSNSPVGNTKIYNTLTETNIKPLKPLSIDCSNFPVDTIGSVHSSPRLFDTSINLKTSPASTRPFSTPRSLGLLEVTHKVINLYNCEECDFMMYSQAEVQTHKKNHMKCTLCQKKFRTIQRTKEHYEECKRLIGLSQPYIPLERFKIPDVLEKISLVPPKKKSKITPVEANSGPKKKK